MDTGVCTVPVYYHPDEAIEYFQAWKKKKQTKNNSPLFSVKNLLNQPNPGNHTLFPLHAHISFVCSRWLTTLKNTKYNFLCHRLGAVEATHLPTFSAAVSMADAANMSCLFNRIQSGSWSVFCPSSSAAWSQQPNAKPHEFSLALSLSLPPGQTSLLFYSTAFAPVSSLTGFTTSGLGPSDSSYLLRGWGVGVLLGIISWAGVKTSPVNKKLLAN